MKTEQFMRQPTIATHNIPLWLSWYEVGMPAVLVAGAQSIAQMNYRSFSTDNPEMPADHNTADLLMVLRSFKSFRASNRNMPAWCDALERCWSAIVMRGQPFCMADVVDNLSRGVKERILTGFFDPQLESTVSPNGGHYVTALDYHSSGNTVLGTLRAAMWVEFPESMREQVRARVANFPSHEKEYGLHKLAELEPLPVPRYQLGWRSLRSYGRLQSQFEGFYEYWHPLPESYKFQILDYVWANAGTDGLDSSEYSPYNLFARCDTYPAADTFSGFVGKTHSALDTSSLLWLQKLADVEPDPTRVVESWPDLKEPLAVKLEQEGRFTLANRVRSLP